MKTASLILGLGRSGVAAARLLRSEGIDVVAVDGGTPAPDQVDALRAIGVEVLTSVSELPAGYFSQAIVSPGVPLDSAWLNELGARNVPCVSELELGWSRCNAKTLAITGSLGKSTVATWCAEALSLAGLQVALAGNIGKPVCEQALEQPDLDVLVLEVSSFQGETLREFRPDVGLFLNLFPNHLDRHGDMERYLSAKIRVFDRMTEGDALVVQGELRSACELACTGGATISCFGVSPADRWTYQSGWVCRDQRPLVDLRGSGFENPVLGVNAAGAVAALDALGVPPDLIARSAQKFSALPHRMEHLATIGGVRFINDSKSTSLTALAAAVQMIEGPVHLIAGGKPKETDFDVIVPHLCGRDLHLYLIGEAAAAMFTAWGDKLDCISSGSLQKAVAQCWSNAAVGDTILLSPGCASFDQFKSFEDRGRQFSQIIEGLNLPNQTKN